MKTKEHSGRGAPDWQKIAFFASLCFYLSTIEYAIPKPLPFFRLGLANLPIILSFGVMSKRESVVLMLCKILLQAVAQGTLFSYVFLFSLCGSLASGLCMLAVYSALEPRVSFLGLSVCGAAANNAAQLALASVFMFGRSVRYIAPVFLAVSLVSSILLGAFALAFCAASEWYKILAGGSPAPLDAGESTQDASAAGGAHLKKAGGRVRLVLCCAAFAVLIFFPNIIAVYAVIAVFVILNYAARRRVRLLPSVFLIFFITLFALFTPNGRILFRAGRFYITEGALLAGLLRGGRLCAFVFVSQYLMTGGVKLPGRAGAFFSLCTAYFARLTRSHGKAPRKDAAEASVAPEQERAAAPKSTPRRRVIASVISKIDARLCEVWRNGGAERAVPEEL